MNPKKLDIQQEWNWYETKYEMAEFILNRLENYKANYNKNGHSLPEWVLDDAHKKTSYSKEDEIKLTTIWNDELDVMITSFKQILNYTLQFDENLEYDEEKIQNGLNKFSKYFMHLWD
jgi:hypothetical protein